MTFERSSNLYEPVINRWTTLLERGWLEDRDPRQLWYLSQLNEAGKVAVQRIWEIGMNCDLEHVLAADWRQARLADTVSPIQESAINLGTLVCAAGDIRLELAHAPVLAAKDR